MPKSTAPPGTWSDEAIVAAASSLRGDASGLGPTDVSLAGASLGLDIRVQETGLAGRLLPNVDGTPVSGVLDFTRGRIVVDGREPEVRRRFTIAHEIGHEVLGHESVLGSGLHVVTTEHDGDGDPSVGAGPMSTLEREADTFAAALLAPPDVVDELVATVGAHVVRIAQALGLSGVAAAYQLARGGHLPEPRAAVAGSSPGSEVVRLLHVSDVDLGVEPYREPVLTEALWTAWSRCVETAVQLQADVLLVSGRLVADAGLDHRQVGRLRSTLEPLRRAGIDVVVNETGSPLPDIDVDVVRPGDPPVELRGLRFALPIHDAPLQPWVLVAHGSLDGLGGRVGDMLRLGDDIADSDATYTALGGLARCQPVTRTAWYAGRVGRVSSLDAAASGGLVVDVDRATGTVQSIMRATWPDHPRSVVALDAFGLGASRLESVLRARLAALPESCVLRLAVTDPPGSADALRALLTESGDGQGATRRDGPGPLVIDARWGEERLILGSRR